METLNAYKRKNNILSVESSQQLGIARLTKLDEARVSAEEALASAEATVSSIALWRKEGRRLDSIPEAIQNPTLAAFKSAKLKAQSDLLQTLIDFGPGHKSVRIQQQIIGDTNQAIAQETENSLVSAQAKLEQAKVRVSIISADQDEARKELMALDQIADEYRMLEDRLKAAESAYRLVRLPGKSQDNDHFHAGGRSVQRDALPHAGTAGFDAEAEGGFGKYFTSPGFWLHSAR